jgi:hypothetical protein
MDEVYTPHRHQASGDLMPYIHGIPPHAHHGFFSCPGEHLHSDIEKTEDLTRSNAEMGKSPLHNLSVHGDMNNLHTSEEVERHFSSTLICCFVLGLL